MDPVVWPSGFVITTFQNPTGVVLGMANTAVSWVVESHETTPVIEVEPD
jgi:hypothetical protein